MDCDKHERHELDCPECEAAFASAYEEHLADYIVASPSERLRVTNPEAAWEAYREEMIACGRGHLLREDER
jgi:hypothetical protein